MNTYKEKWGTTMQFDFYSEMMETFSSWSNFEPDKDQVNNAMKPSGGSSGGNSNSGNGGNGGNGGSGDEPFYWNKGKPLSADEKYYAFGRVAKEAILYNSGQTFSKKEQKSSVMQEIRDLATTRGIMEGPTFPFEAAFDLDTRKIFFYKPVDERNDRRYKGVTTWGFFDYKYKEFYKTKKGNRVEFNSQNVKLNQDELYVRTRLMTLRNNETTLNEISKMPDVYTFVNDQEVYDYLKIVSGLEKSLEPSEIEKI